MKTNHRLEIMSSLQNELSEILDKYEDEYDIAVGEVLGVLESLKIGYFIPPILGAVREHYEDEHED